MLFLSPGPRRARTVRRATRPFRHPARPVGRAVRGLTAGAAVVLAAAACSPVVSIESADVPAWKATALPSVAGVVVEDAGKILNRDPIVKTAPGIAAGNYVLTLTCEGGGKAVVRAVGAMCVTSVRCCVPRRPRVGDRGH